MIKNILINFPTNIGDVILTFPAVDLIRASYPQSQIAAIASSYTHDFLSRYSSIDNVFVYDKHWSIKDKRKFCGDLRGRYDLMIDFKHSLLPLILGIKKHTPLIRLGKMPLHNKDKNISLVSSFLKVDKASRGEIILDDREKMHIESFELKPSICVSTYSRSHIKIYPQDKLKEVLKHILPEYSVILLGSKESASYYKGISLMEGVIDLSGRTTLAEVYYLMAHYCQAILCVDSSLLHLASYLNLKIVALFGPTNENYYGPFSQCYRVITNGSVECRPCGKAECYRNCECMKEIESKKVIEALRTMIKNDLS